MYTESIIGEIKQFGFGFTPKGYAPCSGQILDINKNTALFSLLGTTYGGDGYRTFALPNLNGRAVVGSGKSEGESNFEMGQKGVVGSQGQGLAYMTLNYCICVDGIFPYRNDY